MPIATADRIQMYRTMLLLRRFEEGAAEAYAEGFIGGFTHLYIGQEAVATGANSALNHDDYSIDTYRDHGHALCRGTPPERLMAELYGRATGVCKGKGGSMHFFDAERYFLGGYGIVGGNLPIAAGVAMAIQLRDEDRIVMCFSGEGATNQGVWHEAINLAKLWNLPVIFICENNFYGIGTDVRFSSSHTEIYRRAPGYGDGRDRGARALRRRRAPRPGGGGPRAHRDPVLPLPGSLHDRSGALPEPGRGGALAQAGSDSAPRQAAARGRGR
jgi:pyruvate dehydrogenase E1 component alpha subunit